MKEEQEKSNARGTQSPPQSAILEAFDLMQEIVKQNESILRMIELMIGHAAYVDKKVKFDDLPPMPPNAKTEWLKDMAVGSWHKYPEAVPGVGGEYLVEYEDGRFSTLFWSVGEYAWTENTEGFLRTATVEPSWWAKVLPAGGVHGKPVTVSLDDVMLQMRKDYQHVFRSTEPTPEDGDHETSVPSCAADHWVDGSVAPAWGKGWYLTEVANLTEGRPGSDPTVTYWSDKHGQWLWGENHDPDSTYISPRVIRWARINRE